MSSPQMVTTPSDLGEYTVVVSTVLKIILLNACLFKGSNIFFDYFIRVYKINTIH